MTLVIRSAAMSATQRLFDAITAGDVAAVEQLIAKDPDLAKARDERGVSPVLVALYHRQPGAADAILRQNPTLDVFEAAALGDTDRLGNLLSGDAGLASAYSPDGFMPIGLAAFFGRQDAVRLLIERGADVNAVSRNGAGLTALHSAAACGSASIARHLLQAGADPNARQQGGWTALHSAARHGNRELLDVLLDFNADATVASDDDKTPADLAREAGHNDVAARLTDAPGRSRSDGG